jgi:internalin A
VPLSLWRLGRLEDLRLSSNRLGEMPAEVCWLTGLHRLWYSHNVLRAVPEDLSALTSLETLYLESNPLTVAELRARLKSPPPRAVIVASRTPGAEGAAVYQNGAWVDG